MADALLQLMKEKQFSKITINDISDATGVNRSTWFRNFETKNKALTFKLIQLWHRWADEHGMKERHRYTLDNAETFFYSTILSEMFFLKSIEPSCNPAFTMRSIR